MIELLASIFSLTVGFYSFRKKSISRSGFIALIVICSFFILSDGIAWLAIIFYMFASSSIISKILPQQQGIVQTIAKPGGRDYVQALANLGVSICLYAVYLLKPYDFLMIGFLASIIGANADSWASEIGRLSKKTPNLITTFKPIKHGISGGITMMGTFGGILGGLFIFLLSYFTLQNKNYEFLFTKRSITVILVSGIAGLFIDSYLGAWFQALYQSKVGLNEKKEGQIIKGFHWMTNDLVNFISTFLSAIFGMLLYLWFT